MVVLMVILNVFLNTKLNDAFFFTFLIKSFLLFATTLYFMIISVNSSLTQYNQAIMIYFTLKQCNLTSIIVILCQDILLILEVFITLFIVITF